MAQKKINNSLISNGKGPSPLRKANKKRKTELLEDSPLYNDEADINNMVNNNMEFYERTMNNVFNVALKEENAKLNELVKTEYYPERNKEQKSDAELMKDYLNLVT